MLPYYLADVKFDKFAAGFRHRNIPKIGDVRPTQSSNNTLVSPSNLR